MRRMSKMANTNLSDAKNAKNDEFYTQYADIQKEVNAYIEYDPNVFKDKTILLPCDDPEWSNFTKFFAQNFENFGIRKLISTSYAYDKKRVKGPYQLSFFEEHSPQFDKSKTKSHGKIFTLTRDSNKSGKIDIDDLEWKYLKGDGDFRSEEITKLCDEADIIVTNPPFSLFKEFLEWLVTANKKFLIIGNKNCVKQTDEAKKNHTSNCPLCALGTDSNHVKIWKLNEMDADHVAAWSKGGTTDINNCQMLCKTHNRAKGNR